MPNDRNDNNIFTAEVTSDYGEWWRFNLYLTVAGYGSGGRIVSYRSATDKTYDIGADTTERSSPPPGYTVPRVIQAVSDPCDRIEVYFYAIANTFPGSTAIKDSPPFEMELKVTCNGRTVHKSPYEVNQWGGLTIAGLKISSDGK